MIRPASALVLTFLVAISGCMTDSENLDESTLETESGSTSIGLECFLRLKPEGPYHPGDEVEVVYQLRSTQDPDYGAVDSMQLAFESDEPFTVTYNGRVDQPQRPDAENKTGYLWKQSKSIEITDWSVYMYAKLTLGETDNYAEGFIRFTGQDEHWRMCYQKLDLDSP